MAVLLAVEIYLELITGRIREQLHLSSLRKHPAFSVFQYPAAAAGSFVDLYISEIRIAVVLPAVMIGYEEKTVKFPGIKLPDRDGVILPVPVSGIVIIIHNTPCLGAVNLHGQVIGNSPVVVKPDPVDLAFSG